jgi:hypothetical protein
MRILLGVLLLTAAAAWALPDDREIAAAKEKVQAMLDEAALLEQAGRPEDAARVREEAAALKRKIEQHGGKEERDDPRMQALHNLEKTIVALDKAGYEGMAREARGMADRLRAEIKGRGAEGAKARGEDADFWRRNLETLHVAMKGLAEADRHDAADMVERAIHARKLMLEGRKDEEAQQIMRKAPDDAHLAEFLLVAAGCWREFKQPEKAAQCEELGRFFQHARVEKTMRFARGEQGPGAEDRLARVEERLDRMERMLHETLARLEERDRERERDRNRAQEGAR